MWDFTIHSPQGDANTWVAGSDEFNEAPQAGNTWVGANLAVTVRDIPEVAALTDPVSPSGSLVPVFVGGGGTVYDSWTTPGSAPAYFAGSSWFSTPDAFVSPGMSWDQPFAIEVPQQEVNGGLFAVQHTVSGKLYLFR